VTGALNLTLWSLQVRGLQAQLQEGGGQQGGQLSGAASTWHPRC
jgi:hypothetical protein